MVAYSRVRRLVAAGVAIASVCVCGFVCGEERTSVRWSKSATLSVGKADPQDDGDAIDHLA